MSDKALIGIVLTQARSVLSAIEEGRDAQHLDRELADLRGAAELAGDEAMEERIDGLIAQLEAGDRDGAAVLASFIDDLEPTSSARRLVDTPPPDEITEPVPAIGDSSPTRVHKPLPKRSTKFDASDHLTLLNFFREEAREGIDRITSILLSSDTGPLDDEHLVELMRLTHGLKGAAGTVDLPHIARLSHEYESTVERIRSRKLAWSDGLRDNLVEIADRMRSLIARVHGPDGDDKASEELVSALRSLGSSQAESSPRPDSAPLTVSEGADQTFKERRRPDRRGADSPLLRIEPGRIDRLMNSVGELVFDRTRIEKRTTALDSRLGELKSALSALNEQRAAWVESGRPVRADDLGSALTMLEERLAESLPALDDALERLREDTAALRRTEFSLQDGLTAIRMQSVRSLFQRLTPQLRNIARQAGKRVRLVTAGAETEFDKSVADQLVDPLIQLLRNCVAHGIEAPELREARGKGAEGRITVTARHEANVVVLEVSDDGAGIDAAEIRKQMVERGQWSETKAEQASDERVLQLIFDAGYSTAKAADELAGRGVGLSLVRETVTRLGGEVLVSSLRERGTTFTLRMPLTTAVATALLFKVGGHVFALPNVQVLDEDRVDVAGESQENKGESSLPLLSMHELLGFEAVAKDGKAAVVLVRYQDRELALSVDKVVGPREIVVKNLGPILAGIPLYAGGTISPSGKVQLILDPATLLKLAYKDGELATPPPPAVGKRVMVVDDSRAIREAMRRMLLRAGYEVFTAADGHSAWQALQIRSCDLLVTDLEMPGQGGFELLEDLRRDERFRNMPAIIISSKASEDNRERAASLGVEHLLPKPVSQQDLVDALRAAQRA